MAFGDALQRCGIACLDQIARPKRVLTVGEGNGRFLLELLQTHPGIEVDCIDSSQQMLQLARGRIEHQLADKGGRVCWLCQDITVWEPPPNRYDLIVTHFLLDCFPASQLGSIVDKLGNSATNEAEWLLADFRLPPSGLARIYSLLWLWSMYRFFRLTTGIDADRLVNPTPLLEDNRFVLVRQKCHSNKLVQRNDRHHGQDAY